MTLKATDFNALSTADDVVRGRDLTGLRALVTGSSSGIGLRTATSLARAGAEVVLAVQDERAGWAALAEIVAATGSRRVRGVRLDLMDRATIARVVDEWRGPLHLLVNNAAVMACPLSRTSEGWERHFATNHLGHFELAIGLHAALCAGADERGEARIVAVNSGAHALAPVDFEDPHFDRRRYDPWTAYAQSRTANALFALEAGERWAHDGIVAHAPNAVHPWARDAQAASLLWDMSLDMMGATVAAS